MALLSRQLNLRLVDAGRLSRASPTPRPHERSSKTWRIMTEEERSWFSGSVLDIGCGPDKIVPHARGFDLRDGDANKIDECIADRFDMVFSSHCLEHMHHPADAIQRWWRLVAEGGRMIVIVPDEDLYEQGVYPSRFNGDHKATFTLSKRRSGVLDRTTCSRWPANCRARAFCAASCRMRATIGRTDVWRSSLGKVDKPIKLFFKRTTVSACRARPNARRTRRVGTAFLAVEKAP